MAVLNNACRCPHCEVKLTVGNTETDAKAGDLRMVKCSACETASTWFGGTLRSFTTPDGQQSFEQTPFAASD